MPNTLLLRSGERQIEMSQVDLQCLEALDIPGHATKAGAAVHKLLLLT